MSGTIGGTRSVMVNGTLLEGDKFDEHCRRHGMCTTCGIVQTHHIRKNRFGLRSLGEPIKEKRNERGDLEVYKGYCLQPTCYTLEQAREALGEQPIRRKKKRSSSDEILTAEVTPASSLWPRATSTESPGPSFGSITEEGPGSSLGHNRGTSTGSAVSSLGHNRGTSTGSAGSSLGHNRGMSAGSGTQSAGSRANQVNSARRSTGSSAGLLSSEVMSSGSSSAHMPPLVHSAGQLTSSLVQKDQSFRQTREEPTVTSESELISSLHDAAQYKDIIALLTILENHPGKLAVATTAVQLLREMVGAVHKEHPESYVVHRDTWVKTYKTAMKKHRSVVAFQQEAVLTLWYMSALSEFYMGDVVKLNAVADIMEALDKKDPHLDVLCCGALNCFTRNKEKGIIWGHPTCDDIVRCVTLVIADDSRGGRDLAISTLYNVSNQAAQFEELDVLLKRISEADPKGKWLEELIMALKEEGIPENTTEHIFSLLWRLSALDGVEGQSNPLTEAATDLVTATTIVMSKSFLSRIHEAACGLVANLMVTINSESDLASKIKEYLPALLDALLESLSYNQDVEDAVLAIVHALSNILGDEERLNAANISESLIIAILNVMKKWNGDTAIQQYGCRDLVCICSLGEDAKNFVAVNGGTDIVIQCLTENQNMDRSMEAGDTTELRREALAVCALMASVPSTAVQLVDTISEAAVKSENLAEEMNDLVLTLARTVTTTQLSDKEADQSYGKLAKMLAELMPRTQSRGMISGLMESLEAMSGASSPTIEALMDAFQGQAAPQVSQAMGRFIDVEEVQTAGCGVLGNLYAKASLDQVPSTQHSGQLSIRTPEELKVLKNVLKTHKNNSVVAERACIALGNFLNGLQDDPEANGGLVPSDEVKAAFSGMLKEIVDLFSTCEENCDVQRSALRCAQSLVYVTDPMDLKLWGSRLLEKVFDCMKRFPEDVPIFQSCCSILEYMVQSHGNEEAIMSDLGGKQCVVSLFYSLLLDNAELASSSLGVISLLLDKVFTFSGEILEHDGFIDSIVRCMSRYTESPDVQSEACSILASIAIQNTEPFVKELISIAALGEIIRAIQQNREEECVQENAIRALAAVATNIPLEMLPYNQDTLLEELMCAFKNHRRAEGIQVAVLQAFFGLCALSLNFREMISSAGGIASIIEAMDHNLGSEEVQKSACSVLWILAAHSDNKLLIAREGGIRAVFAAMLAHISSTALQKEAFTTLKNVSAVTENKAYLQPADEVVSLSMWANMNFPSVLAVAMSALNNIAVDSITRHVSTMSEGIMECILTAMNLHPTHKELQKNACFVLRSYSYNVDNLTMMDRNIDKLTELLTLAADAFPNECSERAHTVIEKLGKNYGQ